MKKTTLTKKTQQSSLTSFFSRKPASTSNGISKPASVSNPTGAIHNGKSTAAAEGNKRKRPASPKKSPTKSRRVLSPAKSKIPSPSKKIEQFFSPDVAKNKPIAVAVKMKSAQNGGQSRVNSSELKGIPNGGQSKANSSELKGIPNGGRIKASSKMDGVENGGSGGCRSNLAQSNGGTQHGETKALVAKPGTPKSKTNPSPRRSPRLAQKTSQSEIRTTLNKSSEKVRTSLVFVSETKSDVLRDFDVGNLDEAFFDDVDSFSSSSTSAPSVGNLNLVKLDRYMVESCSKLQNGDMTLVVENCCNSTRGSCFIKSPWNGCVVRAGDVVSLKGVRTDEGWVVDWSGTLVTDPDNLISGTSIVGSLWCMRKAVLSEIFQELGECDPKHLVIGQVVHELLQEVLRKKMRDREDMDKLCESIVTNRDFVVNLFHDNLGYQEIVSTIKSYLPKIYDFISSYVTYGKAERLAPKEPDNWQGEISAIRDIEENIWSPTLGIKGKIDATVQVNINKKSKVMPLELKTGKVSFSMEHRGQVILYCMLLKEIGEFVDSGLLLYLKDEGGMKEIRAGERETRDLVLLRNCLSQGLLDLGNFTPSEKIRLPVLPPPINRKTCESCGLLVACSAALKDQGLDSLPEKHRLRTLAPLATSHLSEEHVQYVFHWIGLQSLENGCSKSNVSKIWTVDSKKREEGGTCLADMVVTSSCVTKGARFETVFTKSSGTTVNEIFEIGQVVIVSSNNQKGITYGIVNATSPISVTLSVEKYFKAKEGPFTLDCYESLSAKKITIKNLSLLLDSTERAQIMRDIIIDLKLPSFAPKLSGKIKKLGMDIFDKLNKEQIRALLQAVSADTYILIQGMPGTGKTTTMRALIKLLVRMGHKILVSSYTHSAIDNILLGLIGEVDMMRIVSVNRAHPKLRDFTEQACLNKVANPTHENLEKMYRSKQVIGVSCLGAGHRWLERQMFDVCLVDEASQVTLPAVLRPLFLAKKFILVGDPKQLPPLVVNEQAREYGLGKSLFHRLDRPAVTTKLTQQYRMNQKITDIANGFAYENLLKCGSEQVANATLNYPGTSSRSEVWLRHVLSKELDDSVIVIDVKNDSPSEKTKENKAEADVIVQVARELIQVGVKGNGIGVISTYREQVDLLKGLLSGTEVEISTVDQYQGKDKDVILYTSSKSSQKVDNDILADTNRLTVAITRAKKKLVVVCDFDFLKTYPNFAKLFSHIPESKVFKFQS